MKRLWIWLGMVILVGSLPFMMGPSFPQQGSSSGTWGTELRNFFSPYYDLTTGAVTATYLPESTVAGLPACNSGSKNQLRRVTDNIRGIWTCDGTTWRSLTGYADVAADFATGGIGTDADPWTGWSTLDWTFDAEYHFRPGTYSYSTPPNWNIRGLRLIGHGGPHVEPGTQRGAVLKFTGTGNSVVFDGTSMANGLDNLVFDNFTIIGNASATNGIQATKVVRSLIRDIRVRNVTGAGLSMGYGVLVTVERFKVSVNEFGLSPRPVNGILLDATGGARSTKNLILNPVIEGVSGYGIRFNGADSNDVIGGTSEANGGGVELTSINDENTFNGLGMEANTTDATLSGKRNRFRFIAGGGTVTITTGAVANTLSGGLWNNITVNVGAVGTRLENLSYAGTITDNGAATQRANIFQVTAQVFDPFRLVRGTQAAAGETGFFQLTDSANLNRRFFFGLDNTLGVNGKVYAQGLLSGTATLPLQLNPTGGVVEIGPGGLSTPSVDASGGVIIAQRLKATGGTALVAGDIALNANWGTASVSAISGTDQRFRFTVTVTVNGTNPATATLTFKDGTWTTAPFAVVSRNGGDQASVLPTWTTSATQLIITFPGTPTAGQTYTFEAVVMG